MAKNEELTVSEVLKRLEGLGSVDRIAAFLKEQNQKGVRHAECPMENYLRKTVDVHINVGRANVIWWVGESSAYFDEELGQNCQKFVSIYDRNGYPELKG